MAKKLNVDQIFKDGFEDYQAKPKHDLEKKMASMIGIGSAAATGTSAAAATSSSSAAGSATVTSTGAAAVATKGGLLSQASVLVKMASLKSVAVLKTLGIIKTIVTIAVIGTATTATLIIAEDIKEDKIIQQQADSKTKTEMMSSMSHPNHQEIELDKKTKLLESKELEQISSPVNEDEAFLASSDNAENSQKELDNSSRTTLESSIVATKTNSNDTYSRNTIEKSTSKYSSAEFEERLLEEMNPKQKGYLNFNNKTLNLQKDSLKLQTAVPQPKSMSTLEEGFYLPNYNICAEISAMPMLFNHLIQPQIINDTVTFSKINLSPQISYQFGAAIRIQKKRQALFYHLGLNYQQLRESVDLQFNREYIDQEQSYWDIDTVYNYFINPPVIDSNIQRIDSAYMEHWTRTEDAQESQNTYNYLEIPIRIGYQFHKYGRKWSIEASSGISTALLVQNTGIIYDKAGRIVSYSDVQTKPMFNFYLLAHLGFNYQMNNLGIFVEPSLKYQINKRTIKSSDYQSRYLIYGVRFGVRFKLFKNAGQP